MAARDSRPHDHAQGRGQGHGHTHGAVDPRLLTTAQGISAVKWSLVILGATAAVQIAIVFLSGSVALLADTVHNVGEDLAGIAVVLTILFSAVYAAYESIVRIVNPQPVSHVFAVAIA